MRNEINLSNEEYRAALMADVRSNLRVIIVTMGIFLFIAISHGMTSPGELMYLLGIPLIPSSFFIVALIKTLIRLHKNKQRENEKGSPIVLPAGLNEKRFIGVVTGSVFKKENQRFFKA